MAGVKRYQDLVAWQLAMDLSDAVHALTETGRVTRDPELRRQLRAAASKPAALIAEGFVRYTTPEFIRYLRLARAEMAEVQTHLERGRRQRYFDPVALDRVVTIANRTMGTITNLLKSKLGTDRRADPYGEKEAAE